MRVALLPLVSLGRRRSLVVLIAFGLMVALWLAAAATVGDAAPPDGILLGPFRWMSLAASA